jgi:hypothetical protein
MNDICPLKKVPLSVPRRKNPGQVQWKSLEDTLCFRWVTRLPAGRCVCSWLQPEWLAEESDQGSEGKGRCKLTLVEPKLHSALVLEGGLADESKGKGRWASQIGVAIVFSQEGTPTGATNVEMS